MKPTLWQTKNRGNLTSRTKINLSNMELMATGATKEQWTLKNKKATPKSGLTV
jgi:hypothetical protein